MSPFHADYRVTQPFGPTDFPSEPPLTWNGKYYPRFHRGMDVVGPSATCPIYAVVPGVVYNAGTDSDGAKYVIELADTGHWICYWHLSAITVAKGRRLDTNTQIGNQGATGHATGNHLHLECHEPGTWLGLLKMTPIDPNGFIADIGGGIDVTNDEDFNNCCYVQGGRFPNDTERAAWKNSGLASYDWVIRYFHFPMKEERDKALADLETADNTNAELMKEVADAKQDAEQAHTYAVNLETQLKDTQDKLQEALKPKPTPPQVDCQMKVDGAVQAALADAERNPWPLLAAWLGNKLKLGGDR